MSDLRHKEKDWRITLRNKKESYTRNKKNIRRK